MELQLPPDSWSWVIGLFEGRGWVTTVRKKGRQTEYVNLGLAMHDPDVLRAAQRLIGGRINGPYQRRGGGVVATGGEYRSRYVLLLARRGDIDDFLKAAYRHLSPAKREEILIAMAKDTRSPSWTEPA